MKATHCPAGSICKDNKCEKQECIGHAMCLAKKGCEGGNCLCRSRKCVKFECTKNTQCKDGCICQEHSKKFLGLKVTVILTDTGENVQKMDASIFDSALSHTRRSDASEKEQKIACPLFAKFACGQVSSPRLYRLLLCKILKHEF